MRTLKRLLARLRTYRNSHLSEQRVAEEIEQHLALQTEENLRAGLSPAEARRQAVLKFGAVEAIKGEYRDQQRLPLLETFIRDVRYGVRQLRKKPGLTATVLLTVGLGIGANTAIFTVDYATLLAPLPYPNAGQLVMIWSKIRGERQSFEALVILDSAAKEYIALLTPREHPRWKELSRQSRDCLHTITLELGIEQIRPLSLSIARNFSPQEAAKAFELCLSWCVRFLVVGGGGGGLLDKHYGLRAMEITKGQITTAKKLSGEMGAIVPNDEVFKTAFGVATVRRTNLARYYLRSIELYVKEEPKPQFVPSEDITAVNLEHVLPVNPSDDWQIAPDVAGSYYRRLGNMVLLGAKDNANIGNKVFRDKKRVFRDSPFLLTKLQSTASGVR